MKANKRHSEKQKERLDRLGLTPHTFPLTSQAKRAIRQVAVDLDVTDYQALDKIISKCSLSKQAYERFS